MIRTTTLLLAGTLFTTGCQHAAVYGDRSFRNSTVYGPSSEFPRNPVYGDASFRDRANNGSDTASRPDSARSASDRVVSSPPPRTEVAVSTPRADQPSSDNPRDELSRSTWTAETESGAPKTRTPEPHQRPAVEPPPAPTPQPVEQPIATTDKPTPDKTSPPRDADPKAIAPSTPGGHDPERVARASSARYPDDLKPSDDLQAVATIDRANRTLRVVNYSSKDVRGGDLWVSETYVTPVPDISSGGSVAVPLNQFFDREGRPLPALSDTSKLQLQSAGKLYNITLQPEELNK